MRCLARRRSHLTRKVDLALISELSTLDAATLRREIDTIFTLRNTHSTPKTLPPPPSEWAAPFRRLAEEVGVPPELAAGHHNAAALLDPVLLGEIEGLSKNINAAFDKVPAAKVVKRHGAETLAGPPGELPRQG